LKTYRKKCLKILEDCWCVPSRGIMFLGFSKNILCYIINRFNIFLCRQIDINLESSVPVELQKLKTPIVQTLLDIRMWGSPYQPFEYPKIYPKIDVSNGFHLFLYHFLHFIKSLILQYTNDDICWTERHTRRRILHDKRDVAFIYADERGAAHRIRYVFAWKAEF